ncbi:hypothetical protein J0671_25205, partial [Vibrio sp. Vb0592]|uniref:hypothetical protein n=1 Tax=Vibrio sp. Vb0592 TaxID=2816072 RepID=UPI001A8D0670
LLADLLLCFLSLSHSNSSLAMDANNIFVEEVGIERGQFRYQQTQTGVGLAQNRTLRDYLYPIRKTSSSCIVLPLHASKFSLEPE